MAKKILRNPRISKLAKEASLEPQALARSSSKRVKAVNFNKQKKDYVHRATDKTKEEIEVIRRVARNDKPGGPELPSFPIVGIGASAGGLEAVTHLLENLPAHTGMAFVLVQHLDPKHESALTHLLARSTKMPVVEAKNNLRVEPDCMYVIPPNRLMVLEKKQLKLYPRASRQQDRMPIDWFLQSLADEKGAQAVGIILSGTGSDGTHGLLAVKAGGGITFAQDEQSAKYAPMPVSAISAGCVDFVLPPAKIASELVRTAWFLRAAPGNEVEAESQPLSEDKVFEEILRLVRQRTSVDFTFYKYATIRRRLHRRMTLHKLETMIDYLAYLRSHAPETKELFNDLLIHVTGFFRDPAVFKILRQRIFPRLLRNKSRERSVRIWVPGCSTGEEVYSLAITLMEVMHDKRIYHPVQIFGTDINDSTLERARAGNYSELTRSSVSAERLQRFFTRTESGYRVNKTIREMCVFARQNLAKDPPFSNLDMVSCRNVLIYLAPTLQRRVMPVFHYALRPEGLLMLGASETVGNSADLFALANKQARIYCKKAVQTLAVSFSPAIPEARTAGERPEIIPAQIPHSVADVQRHADRIVLTEYSPAGVIINRHLNVLQFRGRTGLFLEHPHGDASLDLLKMAREGLVLDLRAAVGKAMKEATRVRRDHVRVRQNGHWLECSIEAIPFSAPPSPEKYVLVLFRAKVASDDGVPKTKKLSAKRMEGNSDDKRELNSLRKELAATRDSLQSIIEEQEATSEEQEATNEELRSANEEILSTNEELQSTNEELETAKEELQSTNEELTTLNDELENRNTELEQVNNDLHNLLSSISIPVIILTAELRIRRFTSMAQKLFKLIPGDVGRPITDINTPLEIPDLDRQVHDVLETLAPRDLELQDRDGRWWSLRIRAYKTMEHKIDGVVLALMDIDALKMAMQKIAQSRDFSQAIVNTLREPLLVLDAELAVRMATPKFYQVFKVKPETTLGRRIYELGNGQWNIPQLRALFEDVLATNSYFNDFEVKHHFPHIGSRKMLLNARRLKLGDTGEEMILLAIEEVRAPAAPS